MIQLSFFRVRVLLVVPKWYLSAFPLRISKEYSFSQSRSQEDEKYHNILGEPEFHAIEPICAVREGFSFLLSNARSLAIISVV